MRLVAWASCPRVRVWRSMGILPMGRWRMKKNKKFDCVRMKRRIQEKIYDQTKDLSREELVAYFRRHAETGPFADLWKKPLKKTRSKTRQTEP